MDSTTIKVKRHNKQRCLTDRSAVMDVRTVRDLLTWFMDLVLGFILAIKAR